MGTPLKEMSRFLHPSCRLGPEEDASLRFPSDRVWLRVLRTLGGIVTFNYFPCVVNFLTLTLLSVSLCQKL